MKERPRVRTPKTFGRSTPLLVAIAAFAPACGSGDDKPPAPPASLDASIPADGDVDAGGGGAEGGGTSDGDGGAAPASDTNGPAVPCGSLPGTLVYIESGDTQENLLKRLGRHLRDTADITLVFNLTGSCTLTSDAFTN
ncbi:MAG: hypothetical protein JOZ69_09030, partial [Myxococcales bacterium]|nr:hypothetical protein [Myxococcales bacterium]